MTFLMVVLTVAIILAFELMRRSHKKQTSAVAEVINHHPSSYEIIDRYYHPGHSWAAVTSANKVTVGIDDFSARMIGDVEEVELPKTGQTIRQGEPFAVLRHGTRSLLHVAPVSGRVTEVNRKVKHQPRVLNNSPMESGWIAKIVPTNLEKDLRNLLKGIAAEGWRDAVRTHLIQLTAPKIGTVMQDGGQIVHNLGDHFSDEEWNRLVIEFFPLVLQSKIQKEPRTKE